MNKPRILIAGTSSNSGKTTATCAILTLLKRRNVSAASLKCGPDYIDPMFHEKVLGIPCANLDPFFCDKTLMRHLLLSNAGRDITVMEGVMGYYDGTGRDGTENSTYTVAKNTGTPVILVVNATGSFTSLIAVIDGFLNFRPDSNIRGIIFNGMNASTYESLKPKVEEYFYQKAKTNSMNNSNFMYLRHITNETDLDSCTYPVVLGYIPKFSKELSVPSRHLGLVTANEMEDITAKQNAIADLCEKTIDIDRLLELAKTAGQLEDSFPGLPQKKPVTIAYAKDDAFCFLYPDTLRLFEGMGATMVPFSPLSDEPVPENADGLFLPGGYPELYAEQLKKNATAKESVRQAVSSGMPAIAECGGFQYLGKALDGHEMCGVLPHDSYQTEHLVRFGYIALSSQKDSLFGPQGTILKGHEFHYWDSTECGSDFSCLKPNGKTWKSGVLTDTLYAGYPHLFLYQNIPAAESFYDKCLLYKEQKS